MYTELRPITRSRQVLSGVALSPEVTRFLQAFSDRLLALLLNLSGAISARHTLLISFQFLKFLL